jgi:hypothetical protein
MEEKKQNLVFNRIATKDSTDKAVTSPNKGKVSSSPRNGTSNSISESSLIKITLKKGAVVKLVKNEEEDYSHLTTSQDIIDLDIRNPNAIYSFEPALFNDFIDKATHNINPFVKIGDTVIVKKKYANSKGHIPRKVKDIYFKSLGNMTVIIAVLQDGELELCNRLQLWK